MKAKIRLARSALVLGIGACMLTLHKPAQDCPQQVGQLPGGFSEVAASGDYAYLGGAG